MCYFNSKLHGKMGSYVDHFVGQNTNEYFENSWIWLEICGALKRTKCSQALLLSVPKKKIVVSLCSVQWSWELFYILFKNSLSVIDVFARKRLYHNYYYH